MSNRQLDGGRCLLAWLALSCPRGSTSSRPRVTWFHVESARIHVGPRRVSLESRGSVSSQLGVTWVRVESAKTHVADRHSLQSRSCHVAVSSPRLVVTWYDAAVCDHSSSFYRRVHRIVNRPQCWSACGVEQPSITLPQKLVLLLVYFYCHCYTVVLMSTAMVYLCL